MNECRYCRYRFETPGELQSHIDYVTGYVPVLCSE